EPRGGGGPDGGHGGTVVEERRVAGVGAAVARDEAGVVDGHRLAVAVGAAAPEDAEPGDRTGGAPLEGLVAVLEGGAADDRAGGVDVVGHAAVAHAQVERGPARRGGGEAGGSLVAAGDDRADGHAVVVDPVGDALGEAR